MLFRSSWVGVKGGDHAGKNETSLLLHYLPELVDLAELPEGELVHARDGCTVDAKEATAEHGAFLARTFLEQAAPKVRELLAEAQRDWPHEVSRGE